MEVDIDCVLHRQSLFVSSLKSTFLRKITKYKTILFKNGIHLSEDTSSECDSDLRHSQSFEDHIELVLGRKSESPNARKTLWKIGSRVSTLKVFRWILQVVQRTKAVRILHHLDGISADVLEDTIHSVGLEIAVAYEYQLVMLDGDIEIIKLAQHAAACMIAYLNSNDASFLPENLLQAIVEIKPQHISNKDVLKTRAVIYNNEPVCLKWHLSQILKQTGLRMFVITKEAQNHLNGHSLPCYLKQDVKPVIEPDNLQNSIKTTEGDTQDIPKTENEENKNSYSVNKEMTQDKILKTNYVDKIMDKSIIDGESSQNNSNPLDADSDTEHEEPVNEPSGVRRKLNVVDMDFDQGIMKVTEHSVIASEFSAVGTCTDLSDMVDGGLTSVDEDFDSEIESVPEIIDEIIEIENDKKGEHGVGMANNEPDSSSSSGENVEIHSGHVDRPMTDSCKYDGRDTSNINTQCNYTCSAIDKDSKKCNTSKDTDNSLNEARNITNGKEANNEDMILKSDGLSYKLPCTDKLDKCEPQDAQQSESDNVMHCTDSGQHVADGSNNLDEEDKCMINISFSHINTPLNKSDRNHLVTNDLQTDLLNNTSNMSQSEFQFVDTDTSNSETGIKLSTFQQTVTNNVSDTQQVSKDNIVSSNKSNFSQRHQPDICLSNISDVCVNIGADHTDSSNNISNIGINSHMESGVYKFYGCFTAYGAKCRPEIYGFRGPLHIWNEKDRTCRFIYNDTVTTLRKHNLEIQKDDQNVHQSYLPKTVCSHHLLN